jgi:gluconate kinase
MTQQRLPVVVVMGVSGIGKSTVGADLAARLHGAYQEGDSLHPAANVDKMSHGIPLTDADRRPWLNAIAAVIDGWLERGQAGVVSCSALKRAYRDMLIGRRQGVALVYLEGSHDLLDSQFATLEPPGEDEAPITVSVEADPDAIVETIVRQLEARAR